MSTESTTIVQRLWNYCNVLRDDGVSYGDYVEQLTYLLFLKMADEQTRPPFNKPSKIPPGLDWQICRCHTCNCEYCNTRNHWLNSTGNKSANGRNRKSRSQALRRDGWEKDRG